jgi:transcription initiation factor IIE alpha subunit
MTIKRKHEMGSGGNCVCPKCDMKLAHQRGVPCNEKRCPDCGAKMVREDSEHHLLIEERKRKS